MRLPTRQALQEFLQNPFFSRIKKRNLRPGFLPRNQHVSSKSDVNDWIEYTSKVSNIVNGIVLKKELLLRQIKLLARIPLTVKEDLLHDAIIEATADTK